MSFDRWILVIGLALRLVGLGNGSLWHDEAFTGLVVELPWPRFWDALMGDVHPPLWYLIERPFVALFGNTDVVLRLPAAICSALALWLFWRFLFVGRIDNPTYNARTAALALMAFTPFQLYYAQEARMYSAVTLCAVMILVAIYEDRPWMFALASVCAFWLHNLGFLLVATGTLALIIVAWRRILHSMTTYPNIAGWWVTGWIGLVLVIPAAVWTWYQATQVTSGYWIVDKSVGAWLYQSIFVPYMGHGVINAKLSWNAAIMGMVLGLGGLVIGIRQRRWGLIILGWLPGLAMLAVSNLIRPMLLGRTLIFASPALYLLAGQLFTTRRRQVALGLCLLPLFVMGWVGHYNQERRGNVGPLVAQIQEQNPEVIIHGQTGGFIVFKWHMPDYRHMLWSGALSGLANAISEQTQAALGMERVALADAPRPAALIYTDYALLSPEERVTMMSELDAAGAELVYVLMDDEYQRVDLWMLR